MRCLPVDCEAPYTLVADSTDRQVQRELVAVADSGQRQRAPCALLAAALGCVGLLASWTALTSALRTEDGQPSSLRADAGTIERVYSAAGVLDYTLRVEPGIWTLPHGISFQTRLYNGLGPSPILCASPGDVVRLTVQNRLDADDVSGTAAGATTQRLGFRQANTTNLHLHGIYDDAWADDTFARVHPGTSRVYEYKLQPRSGSTLLYYHPHADGATTLHSVGGMGGALVITDHAQEAALGLPTMGAPLVAVLQAFNLDETSSDFLGTQLSNGGTSLMSTAITNPANRKGWLLTINGGAPHDIELPQGGWARLQLVNAITASTGSIRLGFVPTHATDALAAAPAAAAPTELASPCAMALIALDGVWLAAPRRLSSLLLPPGGRAEILVGCTTAGSHTLASLGALSLGGTLPAGHAVAVVRVRADAARQPPPEGDGAAAAVPMVPLPHKLPGPPDYYQDLIGAGASGGDGAGSSGAPTRSERAAADGASSLVQRETLTFSTPSGANVVNGQPYNLSRVDFALTLGHLAEWRLVGAEAPHSSLKLHPYHQHFTHFQVVGVTRTAAAAAAGRASPPPEGDEEETRTALLAQVGDWRDTIPLYGNVEYVIRFVAPFLGKMMVHCHIQKHSENGMLAIAEIRPERASSM